MRAKITKRTLQSLIAKEKPYTELAGFILRVQPCGSMRAYDIKVGFGVDFCFSL